MSDEVIKFVGMLVMTAISIGANILQLTTYYMAFKYLMGTL